MFRAALTDLVALLVIVDPIGVAAIFIGLTRGMPDAARSRLACRSVAISGIILFVFAVTGEFVMRALGMSLAAFRIAGGLLLFLLAIEMVLGRHPAQPSNEPEAAQDLSVFPLAIPLIAGPGALTTMVLAAARQQGDPAGIAVILAVMLVALALTLVALLTAGRLVRLLGHTGAHVVSRVLGVVLAGLAVQYVIDGVMGAIAATSSP